MIIQLNGAIKMAVPIITKTRKVSTLRRRFRRTTMRRRAGDRGQKGWCTFHPCSRWRTVWFICVTLMWTAKLLEFVVVGSLNWHRLNFALCLCFFCGCEQCVYTLAYRLIIGKPLIKPSTHRFFYLGGGWGLLKCLASVRSTSINCLACGFS